MAERSHNGLTLVAMPPSGETFVVRDQEGELLLVHPPGAGEPERIDEATVRRSLSEGGFVRIDERFESWAALDAERQRRAALARRGTDVALDQLDASDVERLLRTATRWCRAGRVPSARRLAQQLLRAPAVEADRGLRLQVLELLDGLVAIEERPPLLASDPLYRRARERMALEV